MKKLGALAALAVLVILAIPVAQYGTLSPCGMVKREIVNQARATAESASARGREMVEGLGEEVGRLAEGIGDAVEDAAADVAEKLAEARVEQMSTGECVRELWKLRTEGGS